MIRLWKLAVFGAVLGVVAGCGSSGGRGAERKLAPAVEVERVRVDTVVRSVELPGVVQGEEQAMALAKFAGRVTEVVRPEGSRVSEGEPIAFVLNDIPGMDYKPGPVRAPVSGVVGKLYVEVGQTVGAGTPVAAVSRFAERVKVKAAVSDADVGFVRVGAAARVTVSALPGEEFEGRVSQASAIVDPLSRSASVEVTVGNRGRRLIPGMSAGVRLTLERRAGVPAVPLSALFADGGGRVLVVADSVARLRDIVVGLKGDELVEVRSGLAEGELVVTTGKERIRDGERVNAVPGGLR